MRIDDLRESSNVEDNRGGGRGGGFGGLPIGGGTVGIGTVAVAVIAGWIFGINPLTLLGAMSGGSPAPQQQSAPVAGQADPAVTFVSRVLGSTEDVWTRLFQQAGSQYQQPRLRLFRGSEPTACGTGQSAMGPFYCPADQKIYIDLAFYDTLKTRLGAPGDFAQAYVIAHEVGHHVQHQLGLTQKVDSLRGRVSRAEQNAMSVRLELQADCFAGVWAHHAQSERQILEQGDVAEAMNAAEKIGDDALQRAQGGQVVPDSFTHGSSAQRQRWFATGLKTGSIPACDTFAARSL